MRLLTTLLLALPTFTSAAPFLTPRSASSDLLTQDITNIHNAVLANTASTNSFTSATLPTTLLSGTPVLTTVALIHTANRKALADALLLAAPLSESDTAALFDHTAATVGVSIPAAVQALEAKAQAFAEAGLTGVVAGSLELLLRDHDEFSAAVMGKAYVGDEALTERGEGVVAGIHEAIQGGVDAFSG